MHPANPRSPGAQGLGDLGTHYCRSQSSPREAAEALMLRAGRAPWDRREEEAAGECPPLAAGNVPGCSAVPGRR